MSSGCCSWKESNQVPMNVVCYTSQFLSVGIIIYTAIHDIGLILEASV